MTKLDAGLMTSLPASDSGSAAVWGSKRINPRPQSCLCLTWSGYLLNDDDDDDESELSRNQFKVLGISKFSKIQFHGSTLFIITCCALIIQLSKTL